MPFGLCIAPATYIPKIDGFCALGLTMVTRSRLPRLHHQTWLNFSSRISATFRQCHTDSVGKTEKGHPYAILERKLTTRACNFKTGHSQPLTCLKIVTWQKSNLVKNVYEFIGLACRFTKNLPNVAQNISSTPMPATLEQKLCSRRLQMMVRSIQYHMAAICVNTVSHTRNSCLLHRPLPAIPPEAKVHTADGPWVLDVVANLPRTRGLISSIAGKI